MTLIHSKSDFAHHGSLLTHEDYLSAYFEKRLTTKPSLLWHADGDCSLLSEFYGMEAVRPSMSDAKNPSQKDLWISKADLIRDMVEFLVTSPRAFHSLELQAFIQDLQMAAINAETARVQVRGIERTDPRFTTCKAVSQALEAIALTYNQGSMQLEHVAHLAVHTLLSLGTSNAYRMPIVDPIERGMKSADAAIIGSFYLKSLTKLAVHPGLEDTVCQCISISSGFGDETHAYNAMLTSCVIAYADARDLGFAVRGIYGRYGMRDPGDLRRPVILMVESLKVCEPDSDDVDFVKTLLCGILSSAEGRMIAKDIVTWADKHVRSSIGKEHANLHGGKLALSAGPVISALRRTIDPWQGSGMAPRYPLPPKPFA